MEEPLGMGGASGEAGKGENVQERNSEEEKN